MPTSYGSGDGPAPPSHQTPSGRRAPIAVVGIGWTGTKLFGANAGLAAGLIMAAIFATAFEGRDAKTDAMLLACCVIAQGALAQIYVASRRNEPVAGWLPWLFWAAQGLGILVKGPIAPLLSALTVATLFAFERDGRWLKRLKAGRGVLLAAVIGFAGGALMFYYRWADRLLSPPIVAFQNVPKVALAPIFVVWFGTTLTPRVLVAFVIAFFPVLVNTMVGLRATRKVSLEWVRSMGATRWQTFVKVQLPASLPAIFAGLRVATTLVVIGAVVGEYIAANAGLGYLQLVATTNLDAPILFAAIIVMAILGLILYEIVAFLERLLLPWAKPSEDAAA